MSIAEDLRRDADDALNGGGMYYSGEYLSGIAKKVEAIVVENAKLRELVRLMDERDTPLLPCWRGCDADCHYYDGMCERIASLMDELGIEVEQ